MGAEFFTFAAATTARMSASRATKLDFRLRMGRDWGMQPIRLRPALTSLFIAPVLAILAALSPGFGPAGGMPSDHPAARAAAEPPSIPVHPERQARLAGKPVYGVCFDGTAPRKLAGGPPRLPPDSPLRRYGGVIIAHCLVDDEGYVVAFQLLKAAAGTDPQAVASALAGWRFAPARRAGRTVAVHFMVSIPVPRNPGSPQRMPPPINSAALSQLCHMPWVSRFAAQRQLIR